MQIAPYFAKVECFCFEEQRLLAGEEVDLPVFFFIDRDFVDDPLMKTSAKSPSATPSCALLVERLETVMAFHADLTSAAAGASPIDSRARRDSYGNLVPAEGPLAVANSVPAS